ncbi:hypothetical protein VC83_09056 [Pseudogymnoascus destructans]|uniref:Uncharacterized protein n=2 Tax=Pseudogymnoascus destructans TaxID=655981 RepID=L8GA39_PSED2|nr:uncharacterized protein VC83_09056 [Pseudogymnoascus destructans]ELR10060.1 hypothetical protein GMDG_04461 [Pseudogymnoascus destructans 20631-21]OAF54595.1 hypothetical protein VC83_09056 [Pseudogymnoascus destructans]
MADISHPNTRGPSVVSPSPFLPPGEGPEWPKRAKPSGWIILYELHQYHLSHPPPFHNPPTTFSTIPRCRRITALKPQIAEFHGPNWPDTQRISARRRLPLNHTTQLTPAYSVHLFLPNTPPPLVARSPPNHQPGYLSPLAVSKGSRRSADGARKRRDRRGKWDIGWGICRGF